MDTHSNDIAAIPKSDLTDLRIIKRKRLSHLKVQAFEKVTKIEKKFRTCCLLCVSSLFALFKAVMKGAAFWS